MGDWLPESSPENILAAGGFVNGAVNMTTRLVG